MFVVCIISISATLSPITLDFFKGFGSEISFYIISNPMLVATANLF